MKTRITDLVLDCCPADIDIGEYNDELTTRIIDKVQVHLGAKNQPHRIRKIPRAFLIAAMLALAFGTVAFAIAEYTINLRKPSTDEELVSGFRYEEVVDGNVWNSQILAYPDAGMVFTFTAASGSRRKLRKGLLMNKAGPRGCSVIQETPSPTVFPQ